MGVLYILLLGFCFVLLFFLYFVELPNIRKNLEDFVDIFNGHSNKLKDLKTLLDHVMEELVEERRKVILLKTDIEVLNNKIKELNEKQNNKPKRRKKKVEENKEENKEEKK